MKRLLVLGAAAAVSLQIVACTPSAKDVVEEQDQTNVEQVQATVESKVDDAKATGESVASTASTAVEGLKDWSANLVDVLGTLGAQAEQLEADPTQMSDPGWRSVTEDSIAKLRDLADQATAQADQLAAEDSMSNVQSALRSVASELNDLTTAASEALAAEDAEAFTSATGRLQDITRAVGAVQLLIDRLR